MSKIHRIFFVLLCSIFLLGTTGMAIAKDTTTQKTQPDNKPKVKVTKHQDWTVRCQESGQKQCEMTQLIKSPDNDKPIMRVLMGYPPQTQGKPAMIIIVPLGTRLPAGLQVSVDNGQAYNYPFQVCLQEGCRAAFKVSDALLGQLKNGHSATVSIVGPKNRKIDLKLSLLGFTASSKAISP